MQEQVEMVNQLNDFLRRRGLRANFLAQEVGISVAVLYNFKTGKRLLTHRQVDKYRTISKTTTGSWTEWSDSMTKSDIVSALDELGYDPVTADEAIDDVFQVIAEALVGREKVILRGFGTFEVKSAKGWVGRDIRTGERRKIDNYQKISFRPGVQLKEAVKFSDPSRLLMLNRGVVKQNETEV